jgi:hypothetical protein
LPKGALQGAVEIGIERPADEEAVKLVKPLKDYLAIASAPYVLTPHGTKFKAPVTIEIPVTKQTDKKLVVGWLENEGDKTWKKLGVPSVKDGVAKIAIDHFSVVILLEEERANLAGDEEAEDTNAADAGSSSGTGPGVGSTSSGSSDAPAPSGYDAASPAGALDAGAGGGSWSYDAGYASYDKDAAAPPPYPYPFPPPDAGAYVPPADAGYDAGSPSVGDAGSKSVDAAKL